MSLRSGERTCVSLACLTALLALLMMLQACASGPAVPVPAGEDSTLLVIAAEPKIKDFAAAFQAARVGPGGSTQLDSLSYELQIAPAGRRIMVDPRKGATYVDWLKPGAYTLTGLPGSCKPDR